MFCRRTYAGQLLEILGLICLGYLLYLFTRGWKNTHADPHLKFTSCDRAHHIVGSSEILMWFMITSFSAICGRRFSGYFVMSRFLWFHWGCLSPKLCIYTVPNPTFIKKSKPPHFFSRINDHSYIIILCSFSFKQRLYIFSIYHVFINYFTAY